MFNKAIIVIINGRTHVQFNKRSAEFRCNLCTRNCTPALVTHSCATNAGDNKH